MKNISILTTAGFLYPLHKTSQTENIFNLVSAIFQMSLFFNIEKSSILKELTDLAPNQQGSPVHTIQLLCIFSDR